MNGSNFSIQSGIAKIIEGEALTRSEAKWIMTDIMDGKTTEAQIGSLMTALRMKGETIDEIAGFAEAMRSKVNGVQSIHAGLLDTCGTGGDGAQTFNISTAAAIVAAAGGIRVAKHGNRAMSSRSGSADVLEALGVNIAVSKEQSEQCLEDIGLCFMYAPLYYESMKHASAPRKQLGIRSIFNLLGPLTNPAGAEFQLLGVFDQDKTEILAHVLNELGTNRALVVSSVDRLDEISISAPTKITELNAGKVKTYQLSPDELGLQTYALNEIRGGDALENAELIRMVLNGEKGAAREVILANAGACFYVAGHCSTFQEGVKLAADAIDSGAALNKLQQLIHSTKGGRHVS